MTAKATPHRPQRAAAAGEVHREGSLRRPQSTRDPRERRKKARAVARKRQPRATQLNGTQPGDGTASKKRTGGPANGAPTGEIGGEAATARRRPSGTTRSSTVVIAHANA